MNVTICKPAGHTYTAVVVESIRTVLEALPKAFNGTKEKHKHRLFCSKCGKSIPLN